jgi:hypothetical protein
MVSAQERLPTPSSRSVPFPFPSALPCLALVNYLALPGRADLHPIHLARHGGINSSLGLDEEAHAAAVQAQEQLISHNVRSDVEALPSPDYLVIP